MDTFKTQNKIMAIVNELARYIRKNAPVKFGRVCIDKHIAPSTLHNYTRVLLAMCDDIRYERGTFNVEKHHRMPDGKEVPLEK